MKNLLLSSAAALLVFSTPASAQDGKTMAQGEVTATSLNNAAYAFSIADLNSDGFLSPTEYDLYRIHTVDRVGLTSYRGGEGEAPAPVIKQDFDALDADNDQWISRKEFLSHADVAARGSGDAKSDFVPDYMTVTYYLTATPVKADYFEGREVINLKGDKVGRIEEIIRAKGDHAGLYALVDLDGPDFYHYPGVERDEVGIPLDDLLIAGPGESLMMSMKGEETLRDINAPVVDDYEEVDTLFRISA